MPSFDLSATRDPWVVFARRDSDAIATQLAALASKGGRIYRFEAENLGDAQAVFREFAAQLEFPSYFGRNWDALVDCLDDLCAVVTNHVGMAGVIEGADALLDAPFLRILVSVLCQGAARANSDVDLDGDPLDRPAITQHFVFLLDENPTEGLAATLDHRDLMVDLGGEFLTVTSDPEVWFS